MDKKHTPGPWLRSAFCDSQGFKIKPQKGNLIAIVKVQQSQRPSEAVHNACLISAAPEILNALEKLLGDEKRRRTDLKNKSPASRYSDKNIELAENAIKKARGIK